MSLSTSSTGTFGPSQERRCSTWLYDYTSVQDAEDLLEVDVLGDDRELCGEALVMTGYLTNQENLTGDDLTVLQVYKVFRDVLEETLANQEDA